MPLPEQVTARTVVSLRRIREARHEVDDAELSGANAASKSGIILQASELRVDDSHVFAAGANSFGITATSLVPVDTFLDLKNVFLQGASGAITAPSGVSTFVFGGVVRYATFALLSTTCT